MLGKLVVTKGTKECKKHRERSRRKHTNKWIKNKHKCAQGAGRALRGQSGFVCRWYGQSYDVSHWRTTEGWWKRRDGRKRIQDEGKDREPKQAVDRNELASLFACCLGVIRCDIAWYVSIYRDIISRIMWYHKIRHVEVLYSYPEFWGLQLLSRYRILPKYFSVPSTS